MLGTSILNIQRYITIWLVSKI